MNYSIIRQAAAEFQTPAYLFDLDAFKSRLKRVQSLLGRRVELCYAMKANPFLLKAASEVIRCFEVCSPGEFSICEQVGISRNKLILSGVAKTEEQISYVMGSGGVRTYTIESLNQLKLLDQCSRAKEANISVLLRLSSGNQFGLSLSDAEHIISGRATYPFLSFEGIQYYSGTQKKNFSKIASELKYLDKFCGNLKEHYDYTVNELEYGPGFYVRYFETDASVNEELLLKEFSDLLNSLKFKGHITLEMGRFLTAGCGCYITSIVDCKTIGDQNYCIMDGGINHINYYGQTIGMKIPEYQFLKKNENKSAVHHVHFRSNTELSPKKPVQKLWSICGPLCTQNDVIIKQLPLPDPEAGDLFVLENSGAYSVTEGVSLFLSRALPNIIFMENHDIRLARGQEPTYPLNTPSIL